MRGMLDVYIGTYTEAIYFGDGSVYWGKGEGIYRARIDRKTGAFRGIIKAADAANPSFIATDAVNQRLYTVNELDAGFACAYAVDTETGKLALINRQKTGGGQPCHITTDEKPSFAFVSNYAGGSLCVLPILDDGSLGEPVQNIKLWGSGPDTVRQNGPHPHGFVFDKKGEYALCPDLGADRLRVYRFNPNSKTPIEPAVIPYALVKPKAGPRACMFHPSGKYCFLLNELDATVDVFVYGSGRLIRIDSVSALPEGWTKPNLAAGLQVAPDGRFVFSSNRGPDCIAVYSFEGEKGKLRHAGCFTSGGKTPRDFAVDPAGMLLIAGNQDSGNITVFNLDRDTGGLNKVAEAEIPSPVCIRAYA